jgi:hypothetical protein
VGTLVATGALYRLERLKTLFRSLPMTCTLLGDSLLLETERCWPVDDHFPEEIGDLQHFAWHLRDRIAQGTLRERAVADVLEYELAGHTLRYASASTWPLAPLGRVVQVGSSVRLMRFQFDPAALLPLLASGQRPTRLRKGEFYVVLTTHHRAVQTHFLELGMGRLVWTLATAAPTPACEPALRVLAEAGIVCASA